MFVKRDAQGDICALSKEKSEGFGEEVAPESAEFVAFLQQVRPDVEQSLTELAESDLQMARVMEDVVNLLIDKSIIRFTDLPPAAQKKLMYRKEIRGQAGAISLLGDDDDLGI